MKSLRIIYSLIAVSFIAAVLFSLLYLLHTYQKHNEEQVYVTHKLSQSKTLFQAAQNSYELLSKNLFDNVINKGHIISLVKEANFAEGKAERAPLREELYNDLLPFYKNLRSQNIAQLHFHLQGNTSFLRFHRKEMYGDSLIGVRYSIDKVNRTKTEVHGFEEGKVFGGFRNVYPLLSNRRLVGTAEISYTFNAVRDQIQKNYPGHYDLILNKESINSNLASIERANYKASSLSPKYLIDKRTLSNTSYIHLDKELVGTIKNNILNNASIYLGTDKPFALQSKVQGQNYLITFIPIINIENKAAGYFISYTSDDILTSVNDRYLTRLTVSLLISLLFATVLVLYLLSRKSTDLVREDLGTVDPLTKIANKNKFELVLNTTMHTALRYDFALSILIFDVDDFQTINQKLGTDTGDDILVELTSLVTKQIRLSDLFARWSGEKFVILLPETNHDQATILAEKLRRLIDDHTFGVSIHLTCSFGITQLHKGDEEHSLLARAEMALNSAKERGKNRAVEIE